jgi:hypothetical protein
VGPKAGLDPVAKRRNLIMAPYRELNPGCTARSLVSAVTELPRLHIYHHTKYVSSVRILDFRDTCLFSLQESSLQWRRPVLFISR